MHYNYRNQAWIDDEGKYMACAHPDTMRCDCYGREHAGEYEGEEEIDIILKGIERKRSYD